MVNDKEDLPFWFSERRGATESELVAAERYVGHVLPRSLRELLMKRNGGVSNFAGCEVDDRYYSLLPFCGVDPDAGGGTLMRAHDLRDSFGVPDGVVVFAAQGSGWWGLDYRTNAHEPAVVYRDHDGLPVETVAQDFDEFLSRLTEE